jgi:ribonucleoside-diphosphate reductase alpha chain
MTDDPDLRIANSLMDYLFRRLALEYLSIDERSHLGIFSVSERIQPTLPGVEEAVAETSPGIDLRPDPPTLIADDNTASATAAKSGASAAGTPTRSVDAPLCMQCGVQMQRAGSCYACTECGATSGCS